MSGGFNLVRPCAECPFREDKFFHLAPGRAMEIADSLRGGAVFPCHETVDYSEHDEGVTNRDSQFCAGALVTMEREEFANQMMRIGERLGLYVHTKLNMDSPVHDSLDEWEEAHGG